jgi:P-type Cu+ transporter
MAFHSVADAIQQRDKTINESTADATRLRRRAEEEAFRIVRSAEADAHRIVLEASAHRDAFLAWQTARNSLSDAEEKSLATEREQRLKAGQSPADINKELLEKRSRLLTTRRWLTEFLLSIAAATAALAGRDKVLIDADQLPGKRTLMFFDPELLKGLTPSPPAVNDRTENRER